MEKRVNVKPVKVYLMCDECGIEMERPDEFVFTTYPPQYEYICPKCGNKETSTQGYPYIDFVEEDEFDIVQHIEELDNTINEIKIEPTKEEVELKSLIRQIYELHSAGGALHIVLDDYNVEDDDIQWCIDNAINNNFEEYCVSHNIEEERQLYLRCAELLLQFSEDERSRIISETK